MFINDEDYSVVIGEQALKTVSQVSDDNRANAEEEAIEAVKKVIDQMIEEGEIDA